jgi:hypothetical protein
MIYVLVNGEPVGTWSNLVGHNLINPISVTEFGDTVTGKVWTDVYAGAGDPYRDFDPRYACGGQDPDTRERFPWSSSSEYDRGVFGNADQTDVNFTYDQTDVPSRCDQKLRLYCFEQ